MNTISKKVCVVFFVSLFLSILPSMVYAQSSGAGQQIIGTWIDQDNTRWVFNANGTCSIQDGDYAGTGKFGLSGSRILLIIDNEIEEVMELFFSPDGRTMYIVFSDGDEFFILTKR